MSNMITTPAAIIAAAMALLSGPSAWTKGAVARDAAGKAVPVTHSTAVAWSLDGAVERIVGNWEDEMITDEEAVRRHALELAVFERLGVDPAAFNDAALTFAAVAKLLGGSELSTVSPA